MLVHPGNAYLHELVVPKNQLVPTAVERAFGAMGRMMRASVTSKCWTGGYSFKPFGVTPHDRPFDFSRFATSPVGVSKGSNIACVWTPDCAEVLIGGSRQGHKQFSYAGQSVLGRGSMWNLALQVAELIDDESLVICLRSGRSYSEIKKDEALKSRQVVKENVQMAALTPWPKNTGDDDFSLTDSPII